MKQALIAVMLLTATGQTVAADYTEKRDELGSGIMRTLTAESENGNAVLLVRCADGKDASTMIHLKRGTIFPDEVDFDSGTMTVDMIYKFDTDIDATTTNTNWLSVLSNYSSTYTFDRSVIERIGSASTLSVAIGKSSIRHRFVLRGTAEPVEKILKACQV